MKRTRTEMKIELLKTLAANGTLRRTRLQYKINLGWGRFDAIFRDLEEKGLVEQHPLTPYKSDRRHKYIALTEKGREVTREINEAMGVLETCLK